MFRVPLIKPELRFMGIWPNEFTVDMRALLSKMTGNCKKKNKYQEETMSPINDCRMKDFWKWLSMCPWKWTIMYAYMYIYTYFIFKYCLNYVTHNYFLSLLIHLHLHYWKWKIIKFTIFLIANSQVRLWLEYLHMGIGMRMEQVKDKRGGEMSEEHVVCKFHSKNYLFTQKYLTVCK